MKESPIPFNAPMVRAILAGQKTQTRRVVKPQPFADDYYQGDICFDGFRIPRDGSPAPAKFSAEAVGGGAYLDMEVYCPYGQPSDRLWVREAWQTDDSLDGQPSGEFSAWPVRYEADGAVRRCGAFHGNVKGEMRAPRDMPRWASRILLEIVSVRVERLQDISDADAIAEGIGLNESAAGVPSTNPPGETLPVATFRRGVWEPIYGAEGWEANPWVWVVEFRRIEA